MSIHELERLDKRTIGNVIVNCVHLCNMSIRVFFDICLVVRVFTSLKELTVNTLFILGRCFL